MRSSGSWNHSSWKRGWAIKSGKFIDEGFIWSKMMGIVLSIDVVSAK
jgi:hypothetical protein